MTFPAFLLLLFLASTVHSIPVVNDSSPDVKTAFNVQGCLNTGNVPYRVQSSYDFSQYASPYNTRLPYKPAVIVLPITTQHLSSAVVCAGQASLKVQAKSGGHSYASYSLGGQDGSMVIDMESFQNITVDPATQIASIGTGVRLGNVAIGVYNQGKRALPHGTCPGVGLGGHATHGGFGYSSRAWGLTLDTIVGMEAVLANGTQVSVNKERHPDLWYALRGAASDFAIITTFHLQTQPAPDQVVNWQYNLPNMFTSAITSANYMSRIQTFALNPKLVDRNLGLGMYLDGTTFYISGTYFGTLSDFESRLVPELLSGLPAPIWNNTHSKSWLDSLSALANDGPLQQPLTGYSQHDTFFAKSVVTPASDPLSLAAMTSYFDYMIANGTNNALGSGNSWFSIMNLYGGPDSQINAVPADSSAYSDRSALWVVQHYARASNVGTATGFPGGEVTFLDGLNEALQKVQSAGTNGSGGGGGGGEGRGNATFRAYQNYVDPTLSTSQAHSLYYGDETYQRLLGIKNQLDPGKVLMNPQSVGAS